MLADAGGPAGCLLMVVLEHLRACMAVHGHLTHKHVHGEREPGFMAHDASAPWPGQGKEGRCVATQVGRWSCGGAGGGVRSRRAGRADNPVEAWPLCVAGACLWD